MKRRDLYLIAGVAAIITVLHDALGNTLTMAAGLAAIGRATVMWARFDETTLLGSGGRGDDPEENAVGLAHPGGAGLRVRAKSAALACCARLARHLGAGGGGVREDAVRPDGA